ncbi:MAG: PilZ domain-containing protein [Candidatus Aureabacteria bacterium]|nr:PilZ domain-containing protein [Candidatus Auribacterota bacterium]
MGMFSFLNQQEKKSEKKITEERRRFPRKIKVYIAQCETDSRKSYMTIFNVSQNGLGIYLEEPLERGACLNITIQHEYKKGCYDANPMNLTLPAKVVWIKENINGNGFHAEELLGLPVMQDKKYCAGVELLPMDTEIHERYWQIMDQLKDAPSQPVV